MGEFFLILNFLLKQTFSLKHFFYKLKDNKRQRNLFIAVAIILIISSPSFGAFIYLYIKLYDVLASIGQASFIIVFGIVFSTMIIILLGMFQLVSYFYFANDVKILTPLPIKTRHLLLGKFIIIYLWELIISVFAVLPFFLIYGIKGKIDFLAWINLILSFIFLPIIPLVAIGIIVVIIMRFTNIFKNRDVFRMIGMLLVIVFAVGFQMYMQTIAMSVPQGQEAEFFEKLFTNNKYLIDKVAVYYPIITLVITSITSSLAYKLLSITTLIVLSIGSIYLFSIVLESIYLNTYLNEQEQITKNRKARQLSNKTHDVAYSIMSVDMKTMFRVPIYALNCLSTVIIIPVVLLISTISTKELLQLGTLYESYKYLIWFGCILAITILGPLNVITSTSFSREGKTNWIMRTLPISAKDNIRGRVMSALIVQFVFSIITIGILLFILKTGYIFGVLAVILSLIAAIPLHLIGLYIDLKHPILKWDNPQVAVKQNLNVLIVMGISMIYAMLLVLIYFGFSKAHNVNGLIPFIILYLIYLLLSLILIRVVYYFLEKQFEASLILME